MGKRTLSGLIFNNNNIVNWKEMGVPEPIDMEENPLWGRTYYWLVKPGEEEEIIKLVEESLGDLLDERGLRKVLWTIFN